MFRFSRISDLRGFSVLSHKRLCRLVLHTRSENKITVYSSSLSDFGLLALSPLDLAAGLSKGSLRHSWSEACKYLSLQRNFCSAISPWWSQYHVSMSFSWSSSINSHCDTMFALNSYFLYLNKTLISVQTVFKNILKQLFSKIVLLFWFFLHTILICSRSANYRKQCVQVFR